MCVGSVCTHSSYNDKNPTSGFCKNSYFKISLIRFNSFIRKVEIGVGVSIHKVAEEKLHKHMASHTSGISLDIVRLPKR